jgi:hypothetical protein
MSNQDILTIDQATTIRTDGRAEFLPRDASIRPDRHTFRNFDEFKTYLGQVLGAKVEGQGIRGSMSRKGPYSRRAADGSQPVTFGDPVLDAISSADGMLVIGDETIDLREGLGLPTGPIGADGNVVAHAAPNLKFTSIVNGAERWATDDGSLVEYRLGTGRLYFHAWKKHTIYGYWSMGAEISVIYTPAKFKAADIDSRFYMSVDTPCQIIWADQDSDRNDTYLDEYEWGWNSQQPERVASVCRALWHGALFADVVTAGDGCDNAPSDPSNNWPAGLPPEWTTISTGVNLNGDWTDGSTRNAAISVEFKSLRVDMSAFNRPAASGSIVDWSTIEVTFPDDQTYTGQLQTPNKIRWSNNSVWTKVVNTVMDLNGNWTDGSDRTAVIHEGAKAISVDMSDYDRPNAQGSIVDSSAISVKFPDDRTYTAQLQAPNTIRWSNGSAWTRKT